jgi:hypothetical protein
MKTLLSIAAASLLVSTTGLSAQARTTPGARVSAPVAVAAPPSRTAAPPRASLPAGPVASHSVATHPVLPVGWGLVAGPVGTVNHPGGPGRRGPINPYSQTYIVGASYPIAVYGQQTQQLVDGQTGGAVQDNGTYSYSDNQQQQGQYSNQYAYDNQSASNPAADVVYTLIAFKDHSIYAVVDYWLENNKLSYVTNYGATSSVSLDKIDLPLTEQLNGDRSTKFDPHEKGPTN